MNFGFLFFVFLFSFKALAQNCADMRDGEVIRIDEDNKSLANYRVQDQDGLGSCYANSASLLLQAALPNNPEISYLHLATLYKKENLKKMREEAKSSKDYAIYANKLENADKAINGEGKALHWNLALDMGNTCGVINTVKEMQRKNNRPALCIRTDLNLEKIIASSKPF